MLNAYKKVSVLTRLTLNALLGSRVKLSGELEGRLSVNPGELINAFGYGMLRKYLPALRVALGIAKPEDEIKSCKKANDEDRKNSVLAAKGDSTAIERLREWLIDVFHKLISEEEVLGWLKGFGFDAESLINEFKSLVNGLDGKSLAQLTAPRSSLARLALMLYALINGDGKLAKAHALMGATYSSKLLSRLFLRDIRVVL